jgi:hypothetical protein
VKSKKNHERFSSFIRTLTVGSGFTPDLLTAYKQAALVGFIYHRWGISPRPEDCKHYFKYK